MWLALILGVGVGAIMGLTGAGGGILALPALVVSMGWSLQQATPVALIAVATGATLGTLEGWRRGLVRYRAAVLMAVCGIPASSLGLALARRFSPHHLLLLFALVLAGVAVRQWRQAGGRASQAQFRLAAQIDSDSGRFIWNVPTALLLAAVGALTGVLSGLLGVGGGFVMVPLLQRYTRAPLHAVIATSLMVIALVGIGTVLNALVHGVALPLPFTLYFVLAVATGMLAGRWLVQRLRAEPVQRIFALLLALVALSLLFR
ncbi:sulfite exporter TauE/SafE family protein [Silvimonas sp. JCM 19000]